MIDNHLKKCAACGKEYTPHYAYRNKTQACDGPNGYCAGVIDGWEDREDELKGMRSEIDAAIAERNEAWGDSDLYKGALWEILEEIDESTSSVWDARAKCARALGLKE